VEALTASGGLSRRELRAAEDGFLRLLRCKRFTKVWIAENAADLFAQAQKEYAERLAEGRPAENPVGWLIVCAWQRAKNLLDAHRRRPHSEPIEEVIGLADTATPTPEEEVIDRDRLERLRRAMGFLTESERCLLELTYFEGMSIREAGREQGWGKSSADRHHAAALARLRALLGDQRDLLAGELGLAVWLARPKAHGVRLHVAPGLLGTVTEGAQNAAAWLGHCVSDAWRRLSPFTEPGAGAALGGPARAAGACAAAVACIATGVIGPGVGGVDLIDHASAHAAKPAASRQAPPETSASGGAPVTESPLATQAVGAGESATRESSPRLGHRSIQKRARLSSQPARSQRHDDGSASEQTVTEFGLEGGDSGASAPAPGPEATPAVSSSTATGSSSSQPSAKGSGSAAANEFGM